MNFVKIDFGKFVSQGQKAVDSIKKQSNNDKVHLKRLDLASQKDVKSFAKEMKEKYPQIQHLVNNAGIVGDFGAEAKNAKRTDTGKPVILTLYF